MTEVGFGEEATLFPKTAGERLREYREAQGLTLAEVAARTRVPLRHLEAIEQSNYSGLPSHTYSVGFAKAYARAIGMDEVSIARDVRVQADAVRRPPEYQPYEMQDPKRQAPPGVMMAAMAAALLIVVIAGIWYGTTLIRGDGSVAQVAPAAEVPPPPTSVAPVPTPTPATGGQVSLTATDVVWLRIYDADGKSLFEKELQPGERFDVPSDANRPMINVGRPDKLDVTVNGSLVPPLGDGARAIKDVVISAEALLARGTEPSPLPVADGSGPMPAAQSTGAPPRRFRPGVRSSQRAPLPVDAPSSAPTPTPETRPTTSSATPGVPPTP